MSPEAIQWIGSLGPFAVTVLIAWWLINRSDRMVDKKDENIKQIIGDLKTAIDVITTRHEAAFKQMADSQEKRDKAYESLADKKIIAILELGSKVEALQNEVRSLKAERS